jgi:deaminated glutathione amidase
MAVTVALTTDLRGGAFVNLRRTLADMSSLPLAVLQFTPGPDADANLAVIADAARASRARGARMLVAPEYSSFFVPEFGAAFVDAAQPVEGSFGSGLLALADELDMGIVAGLAEQGSAPRTFRNTLVAAMPGGVLGATYRKVHLYDAFGSRESDWIEPGDTEQLPVVELDGVRVGLQTCYDLRFPETTRRLVAEGEADVVLVPAEWVRGPGKEHHWRTLLTARAIENTVWVVGAGQTPPVAIGNSIVVDPAGVVVAGLGAEPGTVSATIDTERVEAVRAVNPSLAMRRYDVTPR